jgi:NAD(P)-dependent dehydrogenase (short-subunit alcohol dehydrogenase family)
MTVALITGANKGIGFETARQLTDAGYDVYVGARDAERGEKAAAEIGARFVQLDVTDDASVTAALATIEAAEGRLDINAVGIVRVTEAALPLLRRSENPRVVNVSSSMGSFWANTTPARVEHGMFLPLYAASKAAATMLTVQYAKANSDIRFNAVEPGPTATDMTAGFGIEDIAASPAESAKTVVRLATLDLDVPTGTLQDKDGQLAW